MLLQVAVNCMCRSLVVSSCRSRRHLVPRAMLSTHTSQWKCLELLQTARRNGQRLLTILVLFMCTAVIKMCLFIHSLVVIAGVSAYCVFTSVLTNQLKKNTK